MVQIYAATNGYLDRITVDKVDEFLDGLTQRMHAEQQELLQADRRRASGTTRSSSELDEAVKDFAERLRLRPRRGGPAARRGRDGRRQRAQRDTATGGDGDGAGPDERGAEPEQEPAAV